MVKFSIIVPVRNSFEYVRDCIQSVISQNFSNYELIISDNHSVDANYSEYINSFNNPNIYFIKPEKILSMADHFEWALSKSNGEWVVFLGADDGVQPYFFKLAEFLTKKAGEKNIKIINSVRAYFFWKGCQDFYGDVAINFTADNFFTMKNSKYELLNALIGKVYYINLPQMYTTSLVHRSVIEKVKAKQNGYFYSSIIPDANGVCNICFTEKKYIDCKIPLGWVGSSPKSSGLRYSFNYEKNKEELNMDMDSKRLNWNSFMGMPKEGRTVNNHKMHLYESILQSVSLQSNFWKKFYQSKIFKTLFFAVLYSETENISNNAKEEQIKILVDIINKNDINLKSVIFMKKYFIKFIKSLFTFDKYEKKYMGSKKEKIGYYLKWSDVSDLTLLDASNIIKKIDEENNFIDKFIKECRG